ncbi:MAG TPA: S9 family peptidase [Candidatus Polarisedimenticolia bacterium]|jgi:dipeptidyl aminopeptidase/acylaminoacyl peptidase|nr:S9 family peptidase [Candidatus Polarisedimenticolia bacterium]
MHILRSRAASLVFTSVLSMGLSLPPLPAQDSAPEAGSEQYTIDRYLNIRTSSSPTFSPGGERVAFLTNISGTPQVWMIDAAGGWPEQMTFYADRVDFVRGSPRGDALLFAKSSGGDENAQLFWLSTDGSRTRALTNAPGVRHNFGGWSHDGRKISYASNQRNKDYFDIYVMDVGTGREELVRRQDGSNSALAWSFDDRSLIVSHANEKLSLDNDLYLVDTQTKRETHLTPHRGAAQFGDVYFTPSGRSILFGTNDKREFYSLSRMDLATKKVTLLDDAPWDLAATAISQDGSRFAYTINREGFSELYVREVKDLEGPRARSKARAAPLELPGKGVVTGLDFSADNRQLAFIFSGSRYNADVWRYDLETRRLTPVTRNSTAGIPRASFVEPELIRYKTFDGRQIPAWYYRSARRPVGEANRPMPVIVSVHGGPEAQEQPGFNAVYQYFLSRGYAILAPNVRGSTGYGKTYTHLDDVQKREDSVKDLAAAVGWLKSEGGADPRRIAVSGGSYGGYMTLAAVTLYPDLWAAAVDTVGIASFETFLKNTSGYRRKLREVEYGSLTRDLAFLRSVSPLGKVQRIKTPLMVIQGKNDPRVPYTEAEQIVKALRDRGAPVEYKLFDDEGHGIVKLSNRLVVYPLVADFLDRHMR